MCIVSFLEFFLFSLVFMLGHYFSLFEIQKYIIKLPIQNCYHQNFKTTWDTLHIDTCHNFALKVVRKSDQAHGLQRVFFFPL